MSGNDASGPLRPPFGSDAVASHPGQRSYLCSSDLNFSRQRWVPSVYAALHKASGHLIYRSYTAASTHLPPAPSCRHDFKELSPCCQPATVQSSLACCPLDPTRSAQQGASSTYSAGRLSEPGCELHTCPKVHTINKGAQPSYKLRLADATAAHLWQVCSASCFQASFTASST